MRKPTYQVPLGADGTLLHYAPAPHRRYPRVGPATETWTDPVPFEAELTLADMQRGMSAKYVMWTDAHGRKWPMFLPELMEVVRIASIDHGTVCGWWTPRKRGENFGIRYLGPDKPGELA